MTDKKIAVVMGSNSDLPVVKKGLDILEKFEVDYEARVISAHRTPDAAHDFAKNACSNGFGAVIAAAGGLLIIASKKRSKERS